MKIGKMESQEDGSNSVQVKIWRARDGVVNEQAKISEVTRAVGVSSIRTKN